MYEKRQRWLRVSKAVYLIGIAVFLIALALMGIAIFRKWDTISTWMILLAVAGAVLILINTAILCILELREELLGDAKHALLWLGGEFVLLFGVFLVITLVILKSEFSWERAIAWCLIVIGVDKSFAYYQRYRMEKGDKK